MSVVLLSDVTVPTANAVRRTLLSNLPGLAVHQVIISMFECTQTEEVVAHRMAMLPIVMDTDTDPLTVPTMSAQNVVATLSMDVACQDGVWTRSVTDRDVQCDNPAVRVWDCGEPVEILRLRAGQHVALKATVIFGDAEQHAKFQTIVVAAYRVVPKIVVPSGACASELRKVCPRQVFDIEDAPDPTKCVDCDACKSLGVTVDHGPTHRENDRSRTLRFEVECLTAHRPADFHVKRAVAILRRDVRLLAEKVLALQGGRMQ